MQKLQIPQTELAGDTLGAEVVASFGDLILQPGAILAILLGTVASAMYSMKADHRKTKRERRFNKYSWAFCVATIFQIIYMSGETMHREMFISALAIGAICFILHYVVYLAVSVRYPKVAAILEPDQIKHEIEKADMREANEEDIKNPNKKVFVEQTTMKALPEDD